MDDAILSQLNSRLEEFDKRLCSRRNALARRGALTPDQINKMGELDYKSSQLQAKLRAKLAVSRGMDWELFKLEVQNDWLLLTNTFNHWARRLDHKFSEDNVR